MSKELIEQLAKEHCWTTSGPNFNIYKFTLTQLEAFAKAYQAKQPVNVLIEALQKMATYPSTPKDELSATGMRKIASDAIAAYQAAAPIDNVKYLLEKAEKIAIMYAYNERAADNVSDKILALIPATQAAPIESERE
jgi:hypothetical protein